MSSNQYCRSSEWIGQLRQQYDVLRVPGELGARAGSERSARRRRRAYCCGTDKPVGSDLPPATGRKEEPSAAAAAC